LAVRIVRDALIQRLADALRHAAMDLAGDQHRVHGDADIVDRGVAHDARDAGLRIDLDLTDMRAVRPAWAVDLTFGIDAQLGAPFLLGKTEQADARVGAAHGEHAAVIFDVLDRGLERVRRLLARLLDQVAGGDRDRRAADEQRTR